MKHILLNSHTRPFVPSVEDDIGSRPSALLELGACGVCVNWWFTHTHTLGGEGVFCESVACLCWDTPSSTSSLAFGGQ